MLTMYVFVEGYGESGSGTWWVIVRGTDVHVIVGLAIAGGAATIAGLLFTALVQGGRRR